MDGKESVSLLLRNGYHGASPYLMGVTALSTWRYNTPTGFGMQQVCEFHISLFVI